MKLASLNQGRDGKLVVVSRDLARMADAGSIALTMQEALDNWSDCESALHEIYRRLNDQSGFGVPFDQGKCLSPLPRAFQWADGSAYVNHVELVRKARGAEMPESFWTDPLMYQGGSDSFLAPQQNIEFPQTDGLGLDFEGEVAIITGDVPMGVDTEKAGGHILLLMLVNDVSLRGLIPGELAKGFGFFQSKPSSAFSPVAVTPDELGEAWSDYKLNLPLECTYNNQSFGKANAGVDMTFNFAKLISHAARTRPLCAGTIIGSGTVSNKLGDQPGKPVSKGGVGYSCIAEIRMIETIENGTAETPFMSAGDRIQIEMKDMGGKSIFGLIDQTVKVTGPVK